MIIRHAVKKHARNNESPREVNWKVYRSTVITKCSRRMFTDEMEKGAEEVLWPLFRFQMFVFRSVTRSECKRP
jgi:hypothetical protein